MTIKWIFYDSKIALIFRHFFAAVFLLTACSPMRFFYYPNKKLYADPDKLGIECKLIRYPSLNGKLLYGLLFESKDPPKGTVIHFHGNFGNVSNHFLQSQFLVKRGFDVLIFDYQGYGGSEGHASPKITVEDGIATVRYALEHQRPSSKGIVIFGQSLGGAVGTVVAAKESTVKAIVLEASFTAYRSIARDVLKRSAFTWILYPIYPLFIWTSNDPIRYVAKISPRPVLFIHGTTDKVIPVSMTKKLYAAAQEPKKIWIIEGAGHLECRRKAGIEYENKIVDFFTSALETH